MKKIESFFQPVSAMRNSANILMEKISLDEKLERESKEKLCKDEKLKADMVERIAESRRRRAELKKTNENKSDDYQQLQDSINALCDDELNLSNDDPVSKKVKKTWNKRPENWQFIASESVIYGTDSVIRSFKDEFKGLSSSAAKQRVITWRKDLKSPEKIPDYRVRKPAYGSAIEEAVLRNANETREAGFLEGV